MRYICRRSRLWMRHTRRRFANKAVKRFNMYGAMRESEFCYERKGGNQVGSSSGRARNRARLNKQLKQILCNITFIPYIDKYAIRDY